MTAKSGLEGAAATSGRRPRLDQRSIVDAMLELAHAEPATRITFKRLGLALGVDATAMYRHFRNRDEIVRAALDRLFGLAADAGLAAEGSWRARLETYLMRTAELSLAYPAIGAEGALIDPAGPGDAAGTEFMLAMLAEAGLTGAELVQAYAAVSGFAFSQSSALASDLIAHAGDVGAASGAAEGLAREGAVPWITTFGAVDLNAYPHIRAHREALLALDGMAVYRAGATAVLDAVEMAARRAAEPQL